MSETGPEVFIADVCETLFHVNTSGDFVRHFMRWEAGLRERARWSAIRFTLVGMMPLSYLLGRVGGVDLGQRLLLQALRGCSRERIEAAADRYVEEILRGERVDAAWRELEAARGRGARIVLASGGLDVVIERIARNAKAQWCASCLAFDERGRCLGRLARDLHGRKGEELRRLVPDAGTRTLMSDNLSDAALMREVERRIVVRRHARQMEGWKQALGSLRWELLEPGPRPDGDRAP